MTKTEFCLLLCVSASAQTSVVTYHNDNARTGQYLSETLLTPENVKAGRFGKRYSLPVDGAVYAQPLYLSRVKIAGKGLRNVVFIATAHDTVFAYDADDESSTGTQPLWQVSFLQAGATTVPATDVNCPVIPELGIAGTPVIDANAGVLYVIAETKESGNQYVFRLHALDVTSGAERPGSPVLIQPPGFVPQLHKQRTALLLSSGVVYSSWSGHCDQGDFHGWILAHDGATLNLLSSFNDTPNDAGGSFWNGGAGPAADSDGSIFVVSANGDFDGNTIASRYDESVIKLSPASQLSLTDIFTPFNQVTLDTNDEDVGSSGAVLLPDEAGSSTHPHLLFTSGKEGRLYLLDRQNLGGAQTSSDTQAVASIPALNQETFGSAAYFKGSLYVGAANSPLTAFSVANAQLSSKPTAHGSSSFGPTGATPSISANGDQNGIVWVISQANWDALIAYRASDLAELYNSSALLADTPGGYAEFAVPTIADGKVFVGTYDDVSVYGELPADPPKITAVTNAASFSADALSPGSLFTIFGTGLAPLTASAAGTPLPLSLGDVSVMVNGVAAPLMYVSAQQINAQIPSSIQPGAASVEVRVSGGVSAGSTVTISAAAPGIFTDAHGQAAALNPDGSANQPQNPAAAGNVVSLFFTGLGPVQVDVDDGDPAPSVATVPLTSSVSATIGGSPASVQFAGLAPGWVGLGQINLEVPALGSGTFPVVITIGGSRSNPGNLSIR